MDFRKRKHWWQLMKIKAKELIIVVDETKMVDILGKGLLPIKLISPLRTFHNCGSSSNLVLRRKAQNLVNDVLLTKWLATDAVLGGMVLNFIIVNSLLSLPSLSWVNRAPPASKLPTTNTLTNIGETNNSPKKDKIKSKNLIEY